MIVSGLIQGGVFCQDLDDVIISQVAAGNVILHFIIGDAQNNTLSEFVETYYPDASGQIRISGLSELMETYLKGSSLASIYNPTSGYSLSAMYVTLGVVVTQNNTQIGSFSQVFYPCINRTKVYPSTYQYFLSRHKERKVYPDQPIIFSHISQRNLVVYCSAIYDNAGTIEQKSVAVPAATLPGYTAMYQFTLTDIAILIDTSADSLIDFTFNLYDYDNEELTLLDKIRYVVDRNYTPERTTFLFKNVFGVPELLTMTGQNKRTAELDATYAWISRKYCKVSTDLNTLHTICSGWIDKETYASVKDAIKSEEVYVLDGLNIADQVTVTDIDLDYETPRTTPLAAYLTYRVSNKVQETFSRVPEIEGEEDGIFDDTFDDTFE